MGPNLSSIKIFQGTCGCMLCWVFFIVHVMSWLHRAMPLCSTTSKRVPPKITIGCFGLRVEPPSTFCTPLFPPEPNVDMPCLPPGCNSLPCRMPPAALTEASSSATWGMPPCLRGMHARDIIHGHRTLVMNMPRQPALCKSVR